MVPIFLSGYRCPCCGRDELLLIPHRNRIALQILTVRLRVSSLFQDRCTPSLVCSFSYYYLASFRQPNQVFCSSECHNRKSMLSLE